MPVFYKIKLAIHNCMRPCCNPLQRFDMDLQPQCDNVFPSRDLSLFLSVCHDNFTDRGEKVQNESATISVSHCHLIHTYMAICTVLAGGTGYRDNMCHQF